MAIDLESVFEKFEDEFLKFNAVENRLHRRKDVCAFILLDKLVPGEGRDIVVSAEHDEIWLDADPERLAEVATEEDILTLVRCGVRYDSTTDSLAMFV